MSTSAAFIVVSLDEMCRRQQFTEGWFPTLDDVPTKAISMSMRKILAADRIVCTVPDARKAEAVKNSLTGDVSPACPGSYLQTHKDCALFLDKPSASLL